jgi:hypothetical protein
MLIGMLEQMRGCVEAAGTRTVSNMPMPALRAAGRNCAGDAVDCSRESSFMTGHALAPDEGLSAV